MPDSFSLDGRFSFELSEEMFQKAKECPLLVVNDLPTMETNTDFEKVLEVLSYRVEHQGKILLAGNLEYFQSSKEAIIQRFIPLLASLTYPLVERLQNNVR